MGRWDKSLEGTIDKLCSTNGGHSDSAHVFLSVDIK